MFTITKNQIKLSVTKNYKGQKAIVFNTLKNLNGTASTKDIIASAASEIKSKMDAGRVIRYYLCEMKQEGVLRSTGHECGTACLMAVSEDCSCECEGKNHGVLRQQMITK